MRRIGTVGVLAVVVTMAKFGGLTNVSWEHLRIVGEMALVWLVYELVRRPVTKFIRSPTPSPYFNKMMTVREARVSGRPLKLHLKSGEMREGFVLAHSLSYATFVLADKPDDVSVQRHYQADDVDELIVRPKPDQAQIVFDETYAEG